METIAYIDESGTHDKTGKQKGSSVAVVAGLVDYRDRWTNFCADWQGVLNKYSAPYFHFCELSTASLVARGKIKPSRGFPKSNPYASWPLERIDKFLYELAEIVGSGDKVLIGGYIPISNRVTPTTKATPSLAQLVAAEPYKWLLYNFFGRLPTDIISGWPEWQGTLSIVFDQSDDSDWIEAARDAHKSLKELDARFGDLTFGNKQVTPFLPLQAADMVVYRFRQLSENRHNGRLQCNPLPPLDQLILKPLFDQFRRHGPGPTVLLDLVSHGL